jgi:hypothetical protein
MGRAVPPSTPVGDSVSEEEIMSRFGNTRNSTDWINDVVSGVGEIGEWQSVFTLMEGIPTRVYWGAALGSTALSVLLYLTGKRNAALLVGQWPPTFLLLSLFYRLLSREEEPVVKRKGIRQALRRARGSRH